MHRRILDASSGSLDVTRHMESVNGNYFPIPARSARNHFRTSVSTIRRDVLSNGTWKAADLGIVLLNAGR